MLFLGSFLPKGAEEIEAVGIPLICLDYCRIDTMVADMKTLGTILGKEKEANEYIAFFEKYYLYEGYFVVRGI